MKYVSIVAVVSIIAALTNETLPIVPTPPPPRFTAMAELSYVDRSRLIYNGQTSK